MTKKDAFTSSKTAQPPHYVEAVREYLNTRFSCRWIGQAAPKAWPLRSPDLTPLDFFFWGFVKDRVYVPPLPENVAELRTRITAAVAEVTPEMLRRVWQEIDLPNYQWKSHRTITIRGKT
jgi:hypothetical protein